MKILIDGRVLAHDHTSGVQRHAQEITKALKAYHNIDVLIPKYKNRYYQQIWEHLLLPSYARKYDLLYCPSNIAPIWLPKKVKLVYTLHDLAFLDFPQYYSSIFRKYYTFLVPKNLKRAQHIVTISNFSKERIINEYPWVSKKIKVVHHGISSSFSPSEKPKSNYILYVGSMNELKNFQAVLEVFLMPELKSVPLKMILLNSSTFSESEKITALLQKAKIAKNIELINCVNQDELKIFYQKAKLFLFPSFHESFGFPPLEAMACGTPVIVSNKTALPEVCGNAVIYVNPNDVIEILEKLLMALNNETLLQELTTKGLVHIKKFTWNKAAYEYLDIMNKEITI